MPRQMYEDRYENFKFPDYEYREYPKTVYPDSPNGKPLINGQGQATSKGITVLNAEEEAAVMASKVLPVREEDDKARLHAVCEVRGVKYDKRWGNERLREEITAAGHDPEFDPRQ